MSKYTNRSKDQPTILGYTIFNMPTVTCKQCSKMFRAKPSWIKNGYGIYCSRVCKTASSKKGKDLDCSTCGISIYKSLKAIKGSKSGKFFCSKSCQTVWRNQEFIGIKHHNWKTGLFAYRSVLGRNKIPKICVLCRTKDERVLAVHHVDKNRKNNLVSNLAWLCNNCHFLVHHYKDESLKFKKNLSVYKARSKSS